MTIACNECQHSTVCRLKAAYLEAVEVLKEVKIAAPFTFELRCPHRITDTYRGLTYTGSPYMIDSSVTSSGTISSNVAGTVTTALLNKADEPACDCVSTSGYVNVKEHTCEGSDCWCQKKKKEEITLSC